MDEEDQQLQSDIDLAKDQLVQEFETFMALPKAVRLIRSQDLDGLLFAFAELEAWAHKQDPGDDGRLWCSSRSRGVPSGQRGPSTPARPAPIRFGWAPASTAWFPRAWATCSSSCTRSENMGGPPFVELLVWGHFR